MVNVIGHLNPDTDSTVSALVYAWFLTQHRETEAVAYVLGNPNKEALFLLDYFKQDIPALLTKVGEGESFTIVDTNNPNELPDDLSIAKILEVVDHHKLVGGLSTPDPINMTIRPYGCTATVIWMIMQNEGVKNLPSHMAGLLLGAILSDTLNFTSPTTTEHDRKAAEELQRLAQVNTDELSAKMFKAKSDLTGMDVREILLMDSKIFEFGGKKVRISSLETTDPESAFGMLDELKKDMEVMKREEGLDLVILFIIDILQSHSHPVVSSSIERGIVEEAFGAKLDVDKVTLKGIVSRKKQIAPAIEAVLTK